MMGKPNALLWFIVPMFLLTGCWSRVEVNDIAIVTATGLDRMDNGDIKVSIQLAVPRLLGTSAEGGGGGGKLVNDAGWLVSEQGETIMDAYRRIQEKIPRKIFFSHNRAIIIGGKLAGKNVSEVLDFYERYRQSQMRSYILFTKGEAADILGFKPKLEKLTAEVIKEEVKSGIGVHIQLNEFVNMLAAEGQDPFAPQIEIASSRPGADSKEGLSDLVLKGTAVLHRNRIAGWLNNRETRGLLWLRGTMKIGVITVDVPLEKGGGKISAELVNADTKLIPILNGRIPRAQVNVKAEFDVYENTSRLKLQDSENISFLERLIEKDLEQRIGETCDKAQQLKSDITGLGQAIFQRRPKTWRRQYKENWNEIFPNVRFSVQSKVDIRRNGMINETMSMK
ncbi:Ger(x)C family spore germination protein [Cohnella cholangitidis]|uniref:Ger(X)C family spore germination protein n=1 Tax=Cohnella cholangitidis TaxID=2598458 RepID=A0A7G5C1I9_9BACL|nr:Ger(x)C family spore germination protein [Cohnella cholangitidis]QMV43073.1 Ger(x)C family spore germination protein [Cohnella cholangitidis]